MKRIAAGMIAGAVLLLAGAAFGEVPALLHYQGFLTDKEGNPVTGPWKVKFTFYDQQTGGNALFTETQVVEPDAGVFSVMLGLNPGNALDPTVLYGGAAWLELSVEGEGNWVVMTPRQRVASHPYALWTDAAGVCEQAKDAESLGGKPAGTYVTVEGLSELCITEEALPGLLLALGYTPGGTSYTDADVEAYLKGHGYAPGPYFSGKYGDLSDQPDLSQYVTLDQLGDPLTAQEMIDAAAGSKLFLMADGSVVATGNLNLGGQQIVNAVIHNASGKAAPANPKQGQLWWDTTGLKLKVYDGQGWVALSGMTLSDLQCDGCVDLDDVGFNFAASPAKGGAALTAMGLVCEKCVEASALNVKWAAGVSPGGDALSALDVECAGCVTVAKLAPNVLLAENVKYDNSGSGLLATTVQDALDELAVEAGPADFNEGAGSIVSYEQQWGLPSYGTATEYVHLLNPAQPKVVLYVYGGENTSFTSSNNLVVAYDFAPNQYSASVSGNKGETVLQVGNPSIFNPGSAVLILQTVGTGGTGQGAGSWEINQVVNVQGSTLQLAKALANTYTTCGDNCGRAQAVVAASYNQLEVVNGGTVRPSSELTGSGDAGGVVYLRVKNLVVKNGGKIVANGGGFEGGSATGGNCPWMCGYVGDSYCNTAPSTNYSSSPNCSGGGGAGVNGCGAWGGSNYCNNASSGGGGGGNKTAGETGSTGYNNYVGGTGGQATPGGDLLFFGGGGGGGYMNWCQNDRAGDGGGIIVIGATSIIVETGGTISANGILGSPTSPTLCGETVSFPISGSGAGGTVMLFADVFNNTGTVEAKGGAHHLGNKGTFGGAGGEGYMVQKATIPGIVNESYPKGVEIYIDGQNVTGQVGDPNGKGAPAWDGVSKRWGKDGLTPWSTGPLDVTSVANWTLGEHKIELKETGGAGGDLKAYVYVIYPFTKAAAPTNDTCANPQSVDVMNGTAVVSGTTEDTMGKLKAKDDYVQAQCGGSGGPDVVYKITLSDWRSLTVDVNAPFVPRVYIRSSSCTAGQGMACGGAHVVTDVLKPGTYYLFVDGDGNLQKGNFTLTVTATPPGPPENDTCAKPGVLVFENSVASMYGMTLFSVNDYSAGCGGGQAPDNVYKFDVPGNTKTMSVEVAAQFAPVVYLAKASCAGPFIACAPSNTYSMGWPEAGTYYLFVDGKTAADKGEYTVKVTLQP